MQNVIRKSWRDAASLIVLNKRSSEAVRASKDPCNYDILLQTRTRSASFRNSVVFPGGVTEAADARPDWLQLFKSFGFTQADFEGLHRTGTPVTPLFQNNPVLRHIQLRITAIRETFEELGLLICSRALRKDKSDIWASSITDFEVKHWQSLVSKDPGQLLNLCKELDCYPDIWSLYYWSNWLSPTWQPKRFDTAFFLTAFNSKPSGIEESSEVAKVEWSSPLEILQKGYDQKALIYPPQVYELNRVGHWSDIEELAKLARERSCFSGGLYYNVTVRAKDGKLFVYPGDALFPSSIDYNKHTFIDSDKTVLELRESSPSAHRFELQGSKSHLVLKNFKPNNMDMGDKVIQVHLTVS